MLMKIFGSVCPHSGVIYRYITIIFNDFFSETAWLIMAKFYKKHRQEVGTNGYNHVNNPGHMTKMATTV